MEESSEVHSEDNKALPEKSKKRRFKTPSQVEALEKFYIEYKYPSEELKSQIAESVGLSEKQVSGWFCHRRLKDKKQDGETAATGRQDRSSIIVQDHVSGHRQDSCGSTKQGDNKDFEPREVESRRFLGQDFSAPGLAYEHGRPHDGDNSDTSSGSSLPLQHKFRNQNEDPLDIATSRHLPPNVNFAPLNSMGIRTRIGPSGYLKVKGQVENVAITAVKRQLGRHYRDDGPPLGVVFDLLPPGAFESSMRDPVNEASDLGGADLSHSPDSPRICNQPNFGMRYEVKDSKMTSPNSELDGASFKIMRGPYERNNSNPFPGRKLSIEQDEGSAGEMSGYGSKTSKRGSEGRRRIASVSSHNRGPSGLQVTGGEKMPWSHNSYYVSPEDVHREHCESKYPSIALKPSASTLMEDRQLSGKMAKDDKYYGERRTFNEHCNSASAMIRPTNETRGANRDRNRQWSYHLVSARMKLVLLRIKKAVDGEVQKGLLKIISEGERERELRPECMS
ncbi:hypothetical protein RHSIM_Rhsim13G0211200 [Rhododendron simsii]|uniref:Homeobox domain-containing protein n=1 Tax=Rhododendron simsii TaxID=118357 RepID=A0A834G1V1_RHOSS|nr:hypothetical protein RHSIM_Rhsim13G0211200 [Rhododendron simsii]